MWYVVLTVKDDIFRSDFLRSFMQFQHHNIASEHVFIPEINSHCILSQIYALFIEFYYAFFCFLKICIIIQCYIRSVF